MVKVTQVKQEITTIQWAEHIRACRNSGLTVVAWCRENGINPKTYYYHLRKLRVQVCEQLPVEIASFSNETAAVTVSDTSGLTIRITDGTSPATITAIIHALKC